MSAQRSDAPGAALRPHVLLSHSMPQCAPLPAGQEGRTVWGCGMPRSPPLRRSRAQAPLAIGFAVFCGHAVLLPIDGAPPAAV